MTRSKKSTRRTPLKPLTGRERIFQATVDLIRESGPGAATARAICQRCKITAPTLYHHYGDLYQLYDEVLTLMFVPEASAYPGREHTDPLGMLDYMWSCCVETARKTPGLVELKQQLIAMGRVPESMTQFYLRLIRAFEALAQQHKTKITPKKAAAMFWAAATGTANILAASKYGGHEYPAGADQLLKEVILDSILVRPPAGRTARSKAAAGVKRKRPALLQPLL